MKLRNILTTSSLILASSPAFSASYICEACQAGTASDGTECKTCEAGTYSTGSASSCTSCPTGQYQNEGGKSSCKACPAGSKCPTTGMTSPTSCPAGTYSVGSASSCTSCPAGQYQNEGGKSSCKTCPAGSKCPTTGMTSPIKCPVGTYQPNTGKTSCSSCSATTETTWDGGNCGTLYGTYYTYCDNTGETTNKAYQKRTSKSGNTPGIGEYCSSSSNGTISACSNKKGSSYYTSSGGYSNSCSWVCNTGYTGSDCHRIKCSWKIEYSNGGSYSTSFSSGTLDYGQTLSITYTWSTPSGCMGSCSASGSCPEKLTWKGVTETINSNSQCWNSSGINGRYTINKKCN